MTLGEALAEEATTGLARLAIRDLKRLREGHLQSGSDSGLRDVWDEVCVQVQHQESVMWSAYESVMYGVIERRAANASRLQLHAIWLMTHAGEEWLYEVEAQGGTAYELSYCLEDVVEYLLQHVLGCAADWSNPRIRRYLEHY